ncbi:hypothetical protein Tco_0601871 [Tanacetum coccineum]
MQQDPTITEGAEYVRDAEMEERLTRGHIRPRCKEIDEVGEVSIIWNPMCDCSHAGIQTHVQHTSLLIKSTEQNIRGVSHSNSF